MSGYSLSLRPYYLEPDYNLSHLSELANYYVKSTALYEQQTLMNKKTQARDLQPVEILEDSLPLSLQHGYATDPLKGAEKNTFLLLTQSFKLNSNHINLI